MQIKSEHIIDALINLHHWRKGFNHNWIGFGKDPYKPGEQYHYAEAYGLWGQGYITLFNLTRESRYLDLAEQCADWLLENSYTDITRPSWGLPWSWDVWDAPETLSYVTTTIFAGQLFVELYKAVREQDYLNIAMSVASWISQENGMKQTEDGLWVYYANYSPLRYPITNAIALTSGYFWQVYKCTSIEDYRFLASETAKYVLSQQMPSGKWFYSDQSSVVDNLHTGYVLEGLWEGYPFWDKQTLKKLRLGSNFYWDNFYSPSGYGQERSGKGWKAKVKRWLMKFGWRYKITETRLWGYGTAMRTFAFAAVDDECWLRKAARIYNYLERNLSLENGAYAYRATDPSIYIRHQAHIFAGLGQLAQAVKEKDCL